MAVVDDGTMKKWLLPILLILLFAVVIRADFSSQASTGILNISVVTGGGGKVESSTFTGSIHFGSIIATDIISSTLSNVSFGFYDTTNKTFESQPFVNVFVFNGSVYGPVDIVPVIYSDCSIGQNFCEPRFQNATPFNLTNNVGIMNITNSGNFSVNSITFRILSTCSWVNLTYSNTSNLSRYPRIDLNDTLQLVYGPLSVDASFQIFTWANISTPVPGELCDFGSEFDVR